MDQDEPVIQVGNQVFRGSLEPIQGTAVCFQESEVASPLEGSNSCKSVKKLSFLTKTDKMLVMKRVFLQPKQQPPPSETGTSNEETCQPPSVAETSCTTAGT